MRRRFQKSKEYIVVSCNESDEPPSKTTFPEQSSLVSIFNNAYKKLRQGQKVCVVDNPDAPFPWTASVNMLDPKFVGMGLENPTNLYTLYHPKTDFVPPQGIFLPGVPGAKIPQQIYDIFRKDTHFFFFYIMFKAKQGVEKTKKWVVNMEHIPEKESKDLLLQYLRNLLILESLPNQFGYNPRDKKEILRQFVNHYFPKYKPDFDQIDSLRNRPAESKEAQQQTINIINNITITNNYSKTKNIASMEAPFGPPPGAPSDSKAKKTKGRAKQRTKNRAKPKKKTGTRKANGKTKKTSRKQGKNTKKKKQNSSKNQEIVKDLKLEHFPQNLDNSLSLKNSPNLLDFTNQMGILYNNPLFDAHAQRERTQKRRRDRNVSSLNLTAPHGCQTLLRQIPRVYLQNLNPDILGKLSLAQRNAHLMRSKPSQFKGGDSSISLVNENYSSGRTKTKEQIFYLPTNAVKLPLQTYMSQLVRKSPSLVYFNPDIASVCPLAEHSVTYLSFLGSTIVFLEEAKMLITRQNSDFSIHEFNTFLDDIQDRIKGCYEYYRENNLFIKH